MFPASRISQITVGVMSLGLVCALAPAAHAGVINPAVDNQWQWSTIGDPGNRDVTDSDFAFVSARDAKHRGGVDYTYRMSRNMVTVSQWFDFLNAFKPHLKTAHGGGELNANSSTLTSVFIRVTNLREVELGAEPIYAINPGRENLPALGVHWRHTARFVNWLHNDMGITEDAFSNGAYDTSTFLSDTLTNDQRAHHTDAKYWIPTADEWIKGVYWDPDNNGPGAGGYWSFPDGGNEPLVTGLPGAPGAETNNGQDLLGFVPVGSYPNAQTPWGLLDVSGVGREHTATVQNALALRFIGGTGPNAERLLPGESDSLDWWGATSGLTGFRLASIVPTPGATFALGCWFTLLGSRRSA